MSPTEISIPAPAKLNLFLHIVGKLPNGYHQLQTLFQLLDFGDTIKLKSLNDKKNISVNPAISGIKQEDNIAWKAAKALQDHSNCNKGADIDITKKIPIGGGLGGGSSNAASVLLGLNMLWNTGYSIEELADIGLNLGADVPVFIRGYSAFAEGVGEHLWPVRLAESCYLVICPPVHISTATIFAEPELTRDTEAIRIAAFFESRAESCEPTQRQGLGCAQNDLPFFDPDHSGWVLKNDCQAIVEQHYPVVKSALSWLSRYGQAMLTGTGSCIFTRFDSEDDARKALNALPENLKGFIARGVNRSPAHTSLNL